MPIAPMTVAAPAAPSHAPQTPPTTPAAALPTPPAAPSIPALPAAAAAPGPQDVAVPFWTPRHVTVVPSALHDGMLPAAVDAVRGGRETADGQKLSIAQVATLAPFLARAYERSPIEVARELREVRLRTGGPAAGKAGWAVTFGPDIYVGGEPEVNQILSWEGRRWLAHELGHTMQWGRIDAGSDLARTREDLAAYVGGFVHESGPGHGALVDTAAGWIGDRVHHVPADQRPSIASRLHDTHPMEQEAEAHAQDFLRLTSHGEFATTGDAGGDAGR